MLKSAFILHPIFHSIIFKIKTKSCYRGTNTRASQVHSVSLMTVNVKCDSQLPAKAERHIGRPTHIRGNFFITQLKICTIMELETFRYRATKRHKKSSACCVSCNRNVALYIYTDYVGMFVKRKRSNGEEREEISSCLPRLSFLLHSNSPSLSNTIIYIYIYIYIYTHTHTRARARNIHTHKSIAIPLQAWTGSEGSRRLRRPDF